MKNTNHEPLSRIAQNLLDALREDESLRTGWLMGFGSPKAFAASYGDMGLIALGELAGRGLVNLRLEPDRNDVFTIGLVSIQ